MAADDLALVHSLFADWNAHQDLDRQLARYYAEDVEFEVAFQGGRDDANATVLHGRDEVRTYFTDFLQPFHGARWEVDDAVDLGGGEVLALLRLFLRMPGSDAEISPQRFAYVMTIRGGVVARVRDYPDRAEAWRAVGRTAFSDEFDASDLDTGVWIPHYLPMWSSRAESAATYVVDGSELRLTIPREQGPWCPGDHDPLRVSGIQSGVFSGPAGSTIGQQPFRDGLVVREHQPTHWGWTPHYGLLEVRARMDLSPRSMASVWLVGLEDEPTRCGEICMFEVFGDALETGGAAVGMGVHPFRDPALTDEFAAERVAIDVSEPHVYAADWRPGEIEFLIDGDHVKTVRQAPDYPMQMMVAVFDFPDKAASAPDPDHVPELAVDYVRGDYPLSR